MSHKFFFTWEEPYMLHQELHKRKVAFLEKYGEQGLFHFTSDELDHGPIMQAIFSGGMFTTKKLIVISGIPKDSTPSNKASAKTIERLESALMEQWESIPEDSIVILLSYKPDKRTRWYKFFANHAEIKEFKPLKEIELINFVKQRLGELVTSDTATFLVATVGTSLFHIANECDKLQLYANYHQLKKLTPEQIQTIVYNQSEINSFVILDNFFTNKQKTLELITKAQQQSQDMFQFLGMLYRWLRLVIQMVDQYRNWVTSAKEIASNLKLHPFAVAKQYGNIKTLDAHFSSIVQLYHHLLELDVSIKTWALPPEAFRIEIKRLVWEV